MLVSDPAFANSLTISNAAAGHYALQVITVVAAIFIPLVLLYQGWTYYVFRKRLGGRGRTRSRRSAIAAPPASAMRALDPRLLHRTRSARPLLAIDTRARRRHRAGGAGAGQPARR